MESSVARAAGPAQPTEKTPGKALKSPLQQDLGELSPLHSFVPTERISQLWLAGRPFLDRSRPAAQIGSFLPVTLTFHPALRSRFTCHAVG